MGAYFYYPNSRIWILESSGIFWNLAYIDCSACVSAFDRRSWTSGLWPVLTLPEMLACHGEMGHIIL